VVVQTQTIPQAYRANRGLYQCREGTNPFFLFIHQLHETYETRLDHGDVHTFSCFPLSLRLVVAPPALRPGRTNEMTKEKRRETKETAHGHGPLVVLSVSAAPWDCGPYRICYSTVRRWDVLKAH